MVELPRPFLKSLEDVTKERIRGAAWSALRIIEGLTDSLSLGADLCKISDHVANKIVEANPSMSSLYWVAAIFKEGCRKGSPSESLRRLLFEISEARKRIREVALSIFHKRTKVMTFSYSSNVELVLRNAHHNDLLDSIIVLESRPGGEGLVLANSLKSLGIKIKLVPDITMHVYLKDVDFLMVGADTITNDGCLVHKVGTSVLAEKCKEFSKPFIVVFEPFKINLDKSCGQVSLIERDYNIEGWGLERYPLFDITKPSYITLGVTSEGISTWQTSWLKEVALKFRSRIVG